ncbi:Xaa-Pro aminopeptidase 1 [Bienertia sinuspersici]
MALKCGNYSEIEEIYYLIPYSNMDEGLRRVYNDKEVLEMADIVHAKQPAMVSNGVGVGSGTNKQVVGQMRKKQSAVVFDGVGVGSVTNEQGDGQMRKKQHAVVFDGVSVGGVTNEQVHGQRRKKLTPRKCNKEGIPNPAVEHMTTEEVTLGSEETPPNSFKKPDSPIPLKVLLSDGETDNSDPVYEPKNEALSDDLTSEDFDEEGELEDLEDDGDKDEFLSDVEHGDSSDDELKEARQRLKKKNAELYKIAKRLQIEAAGSKLGAEQPTNPSTSAVLNVERHEPLSEYD